MTHDSQQPWTVAQAKSRLSEVLRLASEEGPQYIGARKQYVVVPVEKWRQYKEPQLPMGQWLLKNTPRLDAPLELPDRNSPDRPIPFIDYANE